MQIDPFCPALVDPATGYLLALIITGSRSIEVLKLLDGDYEEARIL